MVEQLPLIVFYVIASVIVLFSILTITAHNPMRSAVFLISALLGIGALYLSLKAEFLFVVHVLVYVGGIMVLFLFVIMLVSLNEEVRQRQVSRQWKTAIILTLVLAAELWVMIGRGKTFFDQPMSSTVITARTQNTEAIGRLLFSQYLLPFEIASVLLLVAIVGAVVLSRKRI